MPPRPLTQLLAEIPDEGFWVPGSSPPKPAYNQIFAEVLRMVLDLPDHDAQLKVRAIYEGAVPNLSSFQRAVAKEAADRRERDEAVAVTSPGSQARTPAPVRAAAPATPPADPPPEPDPDLAAKVRAALPRSTAASFLAHLPTTAPPDLTLQARVQAYLAALPAEQARNEFLDVALGQAIGRACLELIAATARAPAGRRRLVAAAVAYFIDPDDDEHDHQSSIGFFDDAEVVAWVIQELDLPIAPPRPRSPSPRSS